MKRPGFLAALVYLLAAIPGAAIDFTPHFVATIEDGVPMNRMHFTDGTRPIYYRAAPGWTWSGDANCITFTPRHEGNWRVSLQNSPPGHTRIPLQDTGLVKLREIASATLPPDTTRLIKVWETVNPVIIHGWTSFEIGFDYAQSGRAFRRSILFLNLDSKRQIRLIVDAPPMEFQPIYKNAYRTLATWWEP